MRVAQVLCAGTFAGAEAVACGLTRALAPLVDRSALYLVLERRAGAWACARLLDRVADYGLDVRVFESWRRLDGRLATALREALRRDGIDVAHCHSYKPAILLPSGAHRAVFTVHGFDQSSLRGAAFLHAVNVAAAWRSDALVVVSAPLAAYYRRLPGLADRVHVVPNAIPPPPPGPDRAVARERLARRFGLDPARVWVASVGRLVPVKDHRLLLDALGDRAQLLIAGDGPLRAELLDLVRRRGLAQRVRFAGHVDDMDTLWAGADLLALSSASEGCPMVVLEAMSRGVPVLATAVGGVPDLVRDGGEARLVPAGDLGAFRDALRELVDDAALRRRLADAARRRFAAELGEAAWARRHRDLYRALPGR